MQELRTVESMVQKIRDEGQFIPVDDIENIRYPLPGLWRAKVRRTINEKTFVDIPVVQSGDPFVHVRTADRASLFLAWDKVEQYSISSQSEKGAS